MKIRGVLRDVGHSIYCPVAERKGTSENQNYRDKYERWGITGQMGSDKYEDTFQMYRHIQSSQTLKLVRSR